MREYTDMLFDLIDEEALDIKALAQDIIYWVSEDDIKRYMEVNELIVEEEE